MADDKENRKEEAPPNPHHIDIHNESSTVYWSKKWNIPREVLGNIVYRAGSRIEEVKRALGK